MNLRLLSLFLSMLFAVALIAQPAYDNCQTAYDVGTVPFCDTAVIFTNVDATESTVLPDQYPTCFNGGDVSDDVWIAFNAVNDENFVDYTITITGETGTPCEGILNPQVAVYRGDCPDDFYELYCAQAQLGTNTVSLNVYGLTPGFQYFLRINDYSATAASNAGCFNVCIDSIKVTPGIGDGGSNADFGTICDDGGPDSNYTVDQNYTYQICPASPHQCLIYEMEYYNLEASGFGGNGDVLQVYDGDSTNLTNLLATISSNDNVPPTWGGASQTYYAQSGCITLVWNSNASVTFEGFCSNWAVSTGACPTYEDITVTTGATNEEIIAALASPQTEIEVTDINCNELAIGTFQTVPNHPLGLTQGLVLSSGEVGDLINNNVGFFASSPTGNGSDADLNALSVLEPDGGSLTSNDACSIELDVYAYADALSFEFIFGSEEYPEFAETSFNDIFALLISGPGIVGEPTVNNQENMARVPSNGDFIQINSVNAGENWQYYRSNFNDTEGVCLDGLTSDSLAIIKKSITAYRQVIPCNTYHLKFAIADRGDSAYDSAVFVSEISAGVPVITVQFSEGIDYLVEDCVGGTEQLIISLSEVPIDTISFDVEVGGNALPGIDYTLIIPPTVVFLPGQLSFSFPLTVLSDGIAESGEFLSVQLTNDFGCGIITYTALDIEILDAALVEVTAGDTAFMCSGSSVMLNAEGGNPLNYVWAPGQFLDSPFGATPTATPPTSMWFTVTGTVGVCTDLDSVYVQIITPTVSATTSDNGICLGESTTLTAVNNVAGQGIQWFPSNVGSPNNQVTVASPVATTTYTVTVNLAGCTVSSSVTINVDPFTIPVLTTLDTGICQSQSVILANAVTTPGQQFQWFSTGAINVSTISNATATPETSTNYVLITTSQNAYCADTLGPVFINVVPALVNIEGDDYFELCLPDSIGLNVITNTGGVGLSWDKPFSSGSNSNPNFKPTETTMYVATLTLGDCVIRDSVLLRVDSLPTGLITADPDKPVYCPGDVVVLSSVIYEPTDYPDMVFGWSPAVGNETPVDEWNMVITATETITYTRTMTNNACSDEDLILIEVIDPQLNVTPADTVICPGQEVQIVATSNGVLDEISWSPTDGLSCTDCENPVATPSASTLYSVEAKVNDCPVSGTSYISVNAGVTVAILAEPGTAQPQGTPVQLTAVTTPDVSGSATYVWTDETGTNIGSAPVITVVIDQLQNIYNVQVLTADGCIPGLQTIVLDGIAPEIQVPSAFSPNGDGTNDVFNLIIGQNSNVVVASFKVFNRWGKPVYDNAGTTGWDGNLKGEPQPSDLYNYVIDVRLPDGSTKILKGECMLLR